MADNIEISWLAGLLEGEGCFLNRSDRYCSPIIQLMMTDADVVIRAAKSMGAHKVVLCKAPTKAGKRIYRANVYGSTALDLMRQILPFMGERRGNKIRSILHAASIRPLSGYPQRKPYSRGAEVVWSQLQ